MATTPGCAIEMLRAERGAAEPLNGHDLQCTPRIYRARRTYLLTRYEIVAPAVRNDGTPSGYPEALGLALDAAGFGWTAHDTVGCWQGTIEPGREFVVLSEDAHALSTLTALARQVMPDQGAIQVVQYPHPVTLVEA